MLYIYMFFAKLPVRIQWEERSRIVDVLPRTPSGKVDLTAVRGLFAALDDANI